MKKFVYLFEGWGEPTPEVMDAWTNWFASIEDHIVDSGNPFGPGREVTPTGARELSSEKSPITGYSIINADNMDDAEKLLKDCPMLDGVRIYEAVSM